MKEITDVDPSVLVIIVTANGDEQVAVEAFRNGSHDYLKNPGRKNILPEPHAPALPASAAVTLNQYHKIQKAARFINDKYRTDIRLDASAREAGMSPSHFSRTFKKVMGLSYQGYLNNLRITEAKNLLQTSPRSLTEIAVSLGFSDLTGFGRIFKKLTGYTPSAYRNLPRGNFLPKKA
jgi:AraC-like DNA-binding protein